jgi:ketosteroid isomerase-like protein
VSSPDRERTVRMLFERLSARDFRGVVELLHDDVVFDLAYAPDALEMPVRGPEAMKHLLTNVIGAMFDPFRIDVTATFPSEDGTTLVAEYRSEAVVKHNGRPYVNRYVGIFAFEDAKIASWREYHNPEAATAAMS